MDADILQRLALCAPKTLDAKYFDETGKSSVSYLGKYVAFYHQQAARVLLVPHCKPHYSAGAMYLMIMALEAEGCGVTLTNQVYFEGKHQQGVVGCYVQTPFDSYHMSPSQCSTGTTLIKAVTMAFVKYFEENSPTNTARTQET